MKAIVENETAALWRAYVKTRDVATRNQLVLQNLGLVRRISNQYAALLPDAREDLFQEGCLALIRAVERFRPEYGLQFSTYAYPVISGIIKNYLRQRRRLLGHLWWSKDADDQDWQPRYDLMGGKGETLASPSDLEEFLGGVADDFADRVVDRILTETLLARIPPQERRLLRHMFYEDLTQREIAHELARSASRISRLARTALARVRSLLLEVQREESALTTPAGGKALALASAVVDDETGLFGPDHLRRCLAREARRAHVYQGPLTLALLRPHHTAVRSPTTALALTAERIYQSMRVLDHIFRAGPDELALIFPLPSPVACKVCERLRTSKPGLSLSYVTVSYPDDADSTDELLQVARRNLGRV